MCSHLSVLDFRVVFVRPAYDTIKKENPHHVSTARHAVLAAAQVCSDGAEDAAQNTQDRR